MPTFRKIVIPVFVFVIFVGGGFAAYQVADLGQKSAARDDGQTAVNETHIQQVGMYQFVDQSTEEFTAGFNDSVTVYNSSDTELVEGEDYEWNSTEGSIFFYDTANTDDGSAFNITYTYYKNTERVRELSGPLGVITGGLGQVAYFAAGLALVVLILAFGALVGSYLGDDGPQTNR